MLKSYIKLCSNIKNVYTDNFTFIINTNSLREFLLLIYSSNLSTICGFVIKDRDKFTFTVPPQLRRANHVIFCVWVTEYVNISWRCRQMQIFSFRFCCYNCRNIRKSYVKLFSNLVLWQQQKKLRRSEYLVCRFK